MCFPKWEITKDDIPNTLIGKIMIDIMFCDSTHCGNKEAYLELVRKTAKEIVDFFGTDNVYEKP